MDFGLLFTLTLTALGTAVGWINPVAGLMVYYAFAILRPTHLWFWSFGGGYERYSLLVAASTLAGWGLRGFGDWSAFRPVLLPMFGLILYLLAGAWAAGVHAVNANVAWDAWTLQFKIVLMLVVTLTLLRETQHIRLFAWIILICLAYLAWVFNYQNVLQGWNRVWYRGFGGIDNNGVAMVMVMGVPLCFFMAIYDKRVWVRLGCLFAAACLVHVVLFSFSRGGQLGLLMVGTALFTLAIARLPNKTLTLALAVVMGLITLRLAGAEVREEFWSIFVDAEERDVSAASRFDTWAAAWACMKDHPMGVGPRNFNLISQNYGLTINKSVHNLFLQTGADYGFAGMIGLGLFYFGTMWKTWFMAKSTTARRLVWPQYFGHMVIVSLGGFLVCSTFIGMESVEVCYMIAILGLSLVTYVDRMESSALPGDVESIPELIEVSSPDGVQPLGVR